MNMAQQNQTLESLTNAPDFNKTFDSKATEKHFDVSIEEIKQHANRQALIEAKKKGKRDYRLYPIFQSVQQLLDKCLPTLQEFTMRDENGQLVLTEAGKVISSTSEENKTMMIEMVELYAEIDGEPDRLRKGFIKEKVSQTRFTKRGAEYANLFSNLGDKIFALSTICLNTQVELNNLVSKNPVEED